MQALTRRIRTSLLDGDELFGASHTAGRTAHVRIELLKRRIEELKRMLLWLFLLVLLLWLL